MYLLHGNVNAADFMYIIETSSLVPLISFQTNTLKYITCTVPGKRFFKGTKGTLEGAAPVTRKSTVITLVPKSVC